MNDRATAARSDTGPDVGLKLLAGAVAGAVGVWALDRLDWFMWNSESPETRARTIAVRPNGEAPAEALVTKVEQTLDRPSDPAAHQALGQAVHYGIGVAPAIGYALLREHLPVGGAARGAIYGAGLFLVQDELLNAVTGLGAKPQDYPWQDHARGLLAHTLYGVVVELTLNLIEQSVHDRSSAARLNND